MIVEFTALDTLHQLPDAQSTGVGWIQEGIPRVLLIVASGALALSVTSATEPADIPFQYESTGSSSAGLYQTAEVPSSDIPGAIADLRLLSGLTWEQLGELFGVSRRSVHFWASGKPANAANEQRLLRVLDIVRLADRGDVASTRAALLRVTKGTSPFELLIGQRFEEALALLGRGPGRRGVQLGKLSKEAQVARTPPSPGELVEARQDPIPREAQRVRAARTVGSKQRGSG